MDCKRIYMQVTGPQRGQNWSLSREMNFRFSISSRPAQGPKQPHIQWVLGILSLEARQQMHKADHSPPTSAMSKKTWIYTSTPPYVFMEQCFILLVIWEFCVLQLNAVLHIFRSKKIIHLFNQIQHTGSTISCPLLGKATGLCWGSVYTTVTVTYTVTAWYSLFISFWEKFMASI
jgi:hypothetical protein